MTAAERLARAGDLLDQAVEEIGAAAEDAPAFSIDAFRFLRAELKVTRRRIENCRRVIGSGPSSPTA